VWVCECIVSTLCGCVCVCLYFICECMCRCVSAPLSTLCVCGGGVSTCIPNINVKITNSTSEFVNFKHNIYLCSSVLMARATKENPTQTVLTITIIISS